MDGRWPEPPADAVRANLLPGNPRNDSPDRSLAACGGDRAARNTWGQRTDLLGSTTAFETILGGMPADLFISYAWTSGSHRDWVRLLASHMKAIGYDVLIDADVNYGDSLTGFMRRVVECRHVLVIADENYVHRADHVPDSGVATENRWLAEAHPDKPASWLSVLFKDNPRTLLPAWLGDHNPRGHWFNARHEHGDFPGSEQVEELWRWIEDLPSNRDHAVSVATLRARASRLEQVDSQRDPARWANPALSGEVQFAYASAPRHSFRLGHGKYAFVLQVGSGSSDMVYVYADQVKAVGLVDPSVSSPDDLAAHIQPGRVVRPRRGDSVILMNDHGVLCRVDIVHVQDEINGSPHVAPYIDFRYEIAPDS